MIMTMTNSGKGPWRPEEDANLLRLVAAQGCNCWVRIAVDMNGRTAKQCRERYHQNLKPTLNHAPITPEEGALIEQLVAQVGHHWADIARRLGNRSDNAVKNWWNGSMNRRRRNPVNTRQVGSRMHPLPVTGRSRTPSRGSRTLDTEAWTIPTTYGYMNSQHSHKIHFTSPEQPGPRSPFLPMQMQPHLQTTTPSDPMHFHLQSRRRIDTKLSPESRQLPPPQLRDGRPPALPSLRSTFINQRERQQTSPVDSEFSGHALPSLISDSGASTSSPPPGQMLPNTLLPAPTVVGLSPWSNYENPMNHARRPPSQPSMIGSPHIADQTTLYSTLRRDRHFPELTTHAMHPHDPTGTCYRPHSQCSSGVAAAAAPRAMFNARHSLVGHPLIVRTTPDDSRSHIRGLWT